MKRIAVCAILLFTLLLCACGAASEPAVTPEPTPEPPHEVLIGSKSYMSDAESIDLEGSGADLEELFKHSDEFGSVKSISLGVINADMAQINAVADAFPEAELSWRVSVLGREIDSSAELADLSDATDADLGEILKALAILPGIKTVQLAPQDAPTALSMESVDAIAAALPETEINCRFDLYGQLADWTTEQLRYYKTEIGDEGIEVFRSALPYLRSLDLLRLEDCGIKDHDAMAALRDDFPEKRIVWNVYIAGYSFMTDTTLINAALILRDDNVYLLQYMPDVLYLDIGHNQTLTNIEFVRYFPKLQVVILTLTRITDITPLEDCPDIEYLEMVSTGIDNIDVVAGMDKLEYLNLGCMWNLRDISPIYGLKQLKKVRICGSTFTFVKQEQVDAAREALPDTEINTYGGDPTKSGNWRFNPGGGYTERYALLRQQMRYDLVNWKLMLSNSPSGEEASS